MIMSIISNIMGVARGAGIVKSSGATPLPPVFSWVQVDESLVFYVTLCRSLFFSY